MHVDGIELGWKGKGNSLCVNRSLDARDARRDGEYMENVEERYVRRKRVLVCREGPIH